MPISKLVRSLASSSFGTDHFTIAGQFEGTVFKLIFPLNKKGEFPPDSPDYSYHFHSEINAGSAPGLALRLLCFARLTAWMTKQKGEEERRRRRKWEKRFAFGI